MSDFLLDLGQNPQARKLIKSLGLPIPLPEKLRRDNSAWQARPLQDQKIVAGAANNGSLIASVAETITAAGADPYLVDKTLAPIFQQPGETFGRPARTISELDERARIEGIVFDASGINTADELRAVYDFFHPLVNRINRSGRVIVLGRTGPYDSAEQAAAQSALEGFTRSLAKEIGRSGATANLILVEKGSEKRLPATLRFVLSARSAFVTGQPMILNSKAPGHNEPSFVRPP